MRPCTFGQLPRRFKCKNLHVHALGLPSTANIQHPMPSPEDLSRYARPWKPQSTCLLLTRSCRQTSTPGPLPPCNQCGQHWCLVIPGVGAEIVHPYRGHAVLIALACTFLNHW